MKSLLSNEDDCILAAGIAIEIRAGKNSEKHSATSFVHSGCIKNSHNISNITSCLRFSNICKTVNKKLKLTCISF